MAQAYKIRATMTASKDYTVVADSGQEAIEKLMESGIVVVKHEEDRTEDYNEDYDVLGQEEVEEADVD